MMNSDLVMDSADALARLLLNEPNDNEARVQSAYQRILNRAATDAETQRALAFINAFSMDAGAASQTQQAWCLFCQSLLASNEFFYLR
jgi:hypothetical protein